MTIQTDFDVVIIGSGAGGSPIANELVKRGKSVLILEKGPLFLPQSQDQPQMRSDFKRDELYADGAEKRVSANGVSNLQASFFSSHVEPDINDEPHIYLDEQGKDRVTIEGYTAQVVGGGTQLYGGVSLRFTERDLTLHSFNSDRTDLDPADKQDILAGTRDWPIKYAELEKYYCKAEKAIGINGEQQNQLKKFTENDTYQKPLAPNPISQYAHVGMVFVGKGAGPNQTDVLPYRTPLAVITEDHLPSGRKMIANPEDAKTSYVNRFGDPLGLKSSTWVALLKPVSTNPLFDLRTNCLATQLVSNGRKITEVRYLDPSGREECPWKNCSGRLFRYRVGAAT